MNKLFLDLEHSLKRLLVTNNLLAIKAEFEAEGTRIDELAFLSDLCCKHNVPLTLKIGGPTAQRDVYEAFQLGATNIMAPMIESEFAVSNFAKIFLKYYKSFRGLKNNTNLFINIESEKAIDNFDSILDKIVDQKIPIQSLVVGRSDLSASLGINDVNNEKIFDISRLILQKSKKHSLNLAIGGNLTRSSFEFIKSLSKLGLYAFESRKCTFKVKDDFSNKHFNDLILMGLEFELAWLNYKKEIYSIRSQEETLRIRSIESRIRV